jgi:hypothetical protein
MLEMDLTTETLFNTGYSNVRSRNEKDISQEQTKPQNV